MKMNPGFFRSLLVGALACTLGACTSYDSRLNSRSTQYLGTDGTIITKASAAEQADKKSYWDGDGISGAPSIVINLNNQTASFYKGGKLVGVSAVSTGREGYDTPTGNYKIIQRVLDHHSNLYGDFVDASGTVVVKNVSAKKDTPPPGTRFLGASMPNFMRLTNTGVGMHQGFLPGVADSHGCIRMPERMVKIFWDNAPLGTPVAIVH